MKKTLVKLLSVLVAVVTVFAFAGCAEIEDGSKIERRTITLEFYNAAGEVETTTDVNVKLFVNKAPITVGRFLELADSGFYNGTCVSNVATSWFEFGAYTYGTEGLTALKCDKAPIEGEFSKNGWVGNTKSAISGALVMKRDFDTKTEKEGKKYNTAVSTVIVCMSSATSAFKSDSYCIFGEVCSDDAPEDVEPDVDNIETYSSLAKVKTVGDYRYEDDGDNDVFTIYNEVSGKFYTKWVDADGEAHYCEGTEIDTTNELKDDALTDFTDALNDYANDFLNVPYVKIVIKNITK